MESIEDLYCFPSQKESEISELVHEHRKYILGDWRPERTVNDDS